MQWRRGLAVLVATAMLAAQARAWSGVADLIVRDAPIGSRVFLDDKYIGDTPLQYVVPCDDVVDTAFRVESPACGSQNGIVNARPRPGAIVGMVFTLGILAAFICPRYFVPIRVGFDCPPSADAAAQPEAERLRVLRDLHDRGLLSDAEYDAERENALKGL